MIVRACGHRHVHVSGQCASERGQQPVYAYLRTQRGKHRGRVWLLVGHAGACRRSPRHNEPRCLRAHRHAAHATRLDGHVGSRRDRCAGLCAHTRRPGEWNVALCTGMDDEADKQARGRRRRGGSLLYPTVRVACRASRAALFAIQTPTAPACAGGWRRRDAHRAVYLADTEAGLRRRRRCLGGAREPCHRSG